MGLFTGRPGFLLPPIVGSLRGAGRGAAHRGEGEEDAAEGDALANHAIHKGRQGVTCPSDLLARLRVVQIPPGYLVFGGRPAVVR